MLPRLTMRIPAFSQGNDLTLKAVEHWEQGNGTNILGRVLELHHRQLGINRPRQKALDGDEGVGELLSVLRVLHHLLEMLCQR